MSESKEIKWVELTTTDPVTASIYKGLLESSGIPVFLRSDSTNTVYPFTIGVLGDIDVMVPPKELAEARELINNLQIDEEANADQPE